MSIQGFAHRTDMDWHRATAATDQARIPRQKERHMTREIFRTGRIIEAPLDSLWETGVGHNAEGDVRGCFVHHSERF